MSLITNNLLQQGLNKDLFNIIVIETENKQFKQDLLSTKHNILFISESKQINTYIGYNFLICADFITNIKQIQELSRSLHLPICVYKDKPLPNLNNVDKSQIKEILSSILVVFPNIKLQKDWSELTSDTTILKKWKDVFDLMQTRTFTV